jgi:hypothetical protein
MNKYILDLLDNHVAKLPKIDRETHNIAYAKLVAEANQHKEHTDKTVRALKRGGSGIKQKEFKKRVRIYLQFGEDYVAGANYIGIAPTSWQNWIRNNHNKLESLTKNKKGGLKLKPQKFLERIEVYKKYGSNSRKCAEALKINQTTWLQWLKTNKHLI